MNLQELRKYKPEILAIADKYGVSDIRIFGSVARGEAKKGSDVDMLIKLNKRISLLDIVGMEMEMSDVVGMPVHTVSYKAVNKHFRKYIFRDATPL